MKQAQIRKTPNGMGWEWRVVDTLDDRLCVTGYVYRNDDDEAERGEAIEAARRWMRGEPPFIDEPDPHKWQPISLEEET